MTPWALSDPIAVRPRSIKNDKNDGRIKSRGADTVGSVRRYYMPATSYKINLSGHKGASEQVSRQSGNKLFSRIS